MAFFTSMAIDDIDPEHFLPIANGRALSCLALAFAGVFIARIGYVHRARLRSFETVLVQGLGITGMLWWTAGSFAEIEQFLPESIWVSAVLLWIAATVLMLEMGGARSGWTPGRMMAMAGLPAAAIALLAALEDEGHLLANGRFFAWPLIFVSFYFLWERLKDVLPRQLLMFRAGCIWFTAAFSACLLGSLAEEAFDLNGDWPIAGFGAGLAAVLFGGLVLVERERSPFEREPENVRRVGLGPVAGAAVLTIVFMQVGATGDSSPLPHLPILNPIDLVVCLLALGVFSWWRIASPSVALGWSGDIFRGLVLGLLAIAFFCLNGVLVRAVHQWTGVTLDPDRLWDSVAMQVTFSIAWTVVGLVGMLLSSRRGWRQAWMGFAGLLGVVVVKLFTVDLSQLSTVARIGTFLAVGAMLLVLGYLSPVPPGRGDEDESGDPRPEPSSALHSAGGDAS